MKFTYIVNTYVEAESAEDALKKYKRIPAHEVGIYDKAWEKQGFEIKDETKTKVGFDQKAKK